MNNKVTVTRLISKVEDIEVKTTDNKYRLAGQLTSDDRGVRAFDGGGVVRQDDGVEIAHIESWSRHAGLSVRTCAGQDIMVVAAVIKELTDAFTTGADEQSAAEEGGAA